MKKLATSVLAGMLLLSTLAGCGGDQTTTGTGSVAGGADANASDVKSISGEISVISREDGSGTRGAFIELLGIEQKDENGNKVDYTTEEAIIANKTDVMLTNVAGDLRAIGYVSLGSLNDTVKALVVDGIEATPENVKNGSYAVARPFYIATKGEPEGLAADFIDFILSAEGQEIVSNGYIAVADDAPAFAGGNVSGRLVLGGSSSVSPIMEKLMEAYLEINTDAHIELQTSDSTAGMTGTVEGAFDIGMASRALKDTELEQLSDIAIAMDGIAIIVNPENPIDGMTSEEIAAIYTGDTTNWSELA